MVNLSPKLDRIWNHNEGTPPDVSIRMNPGRFNGREDLPRMWKAPSLGLGFFN